MVYKLPADCPYSVKGIKTFRGMEGQGFNATLYRGGKKVALVIDEGCGGSMIFEWVNGGRHAADMPDVRVLEDYAKSLPPIPADPAWGPGHEPLTMDGDLFVAELVGAFEMEQKMRRQMKKKTLFQVGAEIGSDEFRQVNAPLSSTVKEWIANKYPGQQVRILNEEVA